MLSEAQQLRNLLVCSKIIFFYKSELKDLTGFCRRIGVEGLSSGNVARIIQTENDTVPEIIKMDLLMHRRYYDKGKTVVLLFDELTKKLTS